MMRLIRRLQDELGMAVLFITHDIGVVAEMADRVVVLRAGRMEETAATPTLFDAPSSDYARTLMAATPRLGAGAPVPLHGPRPCLRWSASAPAFPGRARCSTGPSPSASCATCR